MMRFCNEDLLLLLDSGTGRLVLEGTGGCGWDSVLLDGWELVVEGEESVEVANGVIVTVQKKQ